MQYWAIQTLNSLALGGLLFLLAAGFSLIFGLMRIANLTHGGRFMLGAYLGVSVLKVVPNLWLAARNLNNVHLLPNLQVTPYHVLNAKHVVFTKAAIEALQEVLSK